MRERHSGFQSPQTVLKTAGLPSAIVRSRPHQFSRGHRESTVVRVCSLASTMLAVTGAGNQT